MREYPQTTLQSLRFIIIAGFVLALLLAFLPGQQQSTSLAASNAACTTLQPDENASRDAWINQDNVTDNKNDSELRVKTESTKLNRSLISFNLTGVVPTNAKVTSAVLSLWVKDVRDGNSTVRAHQLLDYWTENQVTWRYQDKATTEEWTTPGGDYDAAILDSEAFTNGVKDYWATFNVSAAAQAWVANPAANYGVILESPVTTPKSEIKFKSSADGTASQRPKLEVCWDVGVGVTPDNLAQGTAGQNKIYGHTVTVTDFSNEPVGLTAVSNQGWTVNIYKDVNGNGQKDVGDTAITQTPPIGPNGSYKILIEVVVPANAANGTKDITTVTATGLTNGTVATAKDTTLVGFPPTPDPVLDGRRDLAYTQNLDSNTQDYCDASGKVLARLMTLYDATSPNYVWVILEMELAHVDNSYGTTVHPSWTAVGKSHSLGNLEGSDKGQLLVRDANGTLIFDVTSDYVESGRPTVSGWGSAGVTGGEGSVAVGNASEVAVESSIGYNLNRFCASSGSCTVSGVNLFLNSPPVNADYTPQSSFFADWQYPYLYEFRFNAAAFGSAGFGSATINNVHVSPNKTGSNEILVTPCNGSIGDRVWQDYDGDKVQDSNEPGLNGVMVNLYRDTGNGTFEPATDLAINTRFTAGDGDYDFTGLGPGTYFVDVVESTIPADYVLTTANEPMKVILAKGQDFNDADFGYRTVPNIAISKKLISGAAVVGSQVEFSIVITNTGNTVIDVLPLEDFYDPTYLQFVSATPAHSSVAGGVVKWNDLTLTAGNLAVGASTSVTVRFTALKVTGNVVRSALDVDKTTAGPTVDGLVKNDENYIFAGRADPAGNAPGNLYKSIGTNLCYYAFVVDRAFNDNVYAENDDPYLLLDGWKGGGHKYSNLDGSDKAIFTVTGSAGSHPNLEMDYITKSGSAYTVAFFTAPINDAKTSLWYNLNQSGWNGNGPAPQYVNGNVEYHSPPYNWNDTPGQYWEWNMIYEFSIPKTSVGADCGTVTLAGAHNSPSKNDASLGKIGDYIWKDLDGQGDQDETNAGIPGVRVHLRQNNVIVRTTQTEQGTSGYYIFNNLPAGTYVVDVDESTLPAGHTLTTNNEPKTVILSSGQSYLLADFGYVPGQGKIGDRVYYDINGDGGLDNDNEPGINNVTVNLFQGSCPGSGTPFKTQVTSGNGDYLFTMLPAGTYCVNVDDATLPANYTLTTAPEPRQVVLAQDQSYLLADFGYQVQDPGKTCDVATAFGVKDQYGTSPADKSASACVEIKGMDFGDLPDTTAGTAAGDYQTLLANNGPRHTITDLKMGATVDGELDGQPNATATGDGSDEDGVTIPTLIRGQTATVVVNSSGPGKLNAFFDWNNDGDFLDAGEAIAQLNVVAGNNNLSVPVPATAVTGVNLGARFRLSTNGGLGAVGNSGGINLPSVNEIGKYLVIGMGDDANIGRAYQMSNTEIGADRKILSVAQDPGYITDGGFPNLFDVFSTRWNVSTDPDSVNGAEHLFQGIDWSGEVALTSDNGKFDSSNSLVFADTGIQTVHGSPLVSVSNSKFYDVSITGPTGPNLAIGNGVTTGNNYAALLAELANWKSYLLARTADSTISNFGPFSNNAASGGAGGLRTSYSDTNGDGIIVVDLNSPSVDFNMTNLDWVITSTDGKLIVFRLRNGSNMVMNNVTIQLADNTFAQNRIGAVFLSAYEPSPSSDTVFNVGSNLILNGIGFWDLNAVGEGGTSTNTLIHINNAQGCAQFISQKVNFQNNRWNRCAVGPGVPGNVIPDGEIEDYLVRVEAPGIVIEKTTNGASADLPDGADVKQIAPGATVTWQYLITNNGTTSINRSDIAVSDNVIGNLMVAGVVQTLAAPYTGVTLVSGAALSDNVLSPNESFTLQVTRPAENLGTKDPNASPTDQYVVGCRDAITDPDGRTTYKNTGTVTVPGATSSDDSHYCNPPELGSIGNYVWVDENSDGYQDAGEPGIPNVRIQLKNSSATVIARTWTDAKGGYLFTNLPDATYFVDVDESTLPVGMTQTPYRLQGSDFGNQDHSGNGYQVVLPTSGENLTADFGYNFNTTVCVDGDPTCNDVTATIGDRVWVDANGNGKQDPAEVGIPGVQVTLKFDPDNDGIYTTAFTVNTDSNGNYLFDGLPPAAYIVTVTPPGGYTQTGDPDQWGVTCTACDNQTTTPVILAPGDVFLNADFGYQPPATHNNSIGDKVWFDLDGDGVGPSGHGAAPGNDNSEPGIPGVTVALIKDVNNDGMWDPDGVDNLPRTNDDEVILGRTTTDSNGAYLFTGLPDGSYLVWVNDTSNVLADKVPTYDSNGGVVPSNLNAPFGVASNTVLGISSVLNLGVGSTTAVSNLAQDFGYKVPDQDPGEGLIGDRVWLDFTNLGVQDANEPGIEGVRVELRDNTNTVLNVTFTDENGNYYFGGLPAGTYTVIVTPPTGMVQTYDADNGTGPFSSPHQSTVTIPSGGVNLLQDFGYRGLGTVGDLVWNDVNGDGDVDGGETGISGVTLDIYWDLNGNEKVEPGEPRLGSTTTDSNGAYLFRGLPTDDGGGNAQFVVDVTDTAAVLNGYVHSLGTPSLNNHSQTDPEAVQLTPGAPNYLAADFGYYIRPAALGNFVWRDSNYNGLQDANEPGLNGVKVTMTAKYANGATFTFVTLTGDDPSTGPVEQGWYSFGNLLLDEDHISSKTGTPTATQPVYTISVSTAPAGYLPTAVDQGANDMTDSDNHAGVDGLATQGQLNVTQNANPNAESNPIAGYDFGYVLTPPYLITKQLRTVDPVRNGEPISFTIRITNTSTVPFSTIPLTDSYDTTYLTFVGSTPATEDQINDGLLNWGDLTQFGTKGFGADLLPGQSFSVIVTFVGREDTTTLPAQLPCTEFGKTCNIAAVVGAKYDPDGAGGVPEQGPLPTKSAWDDVQIMVPTGLDVVDTTASSWVDGITLSWRTVNEAEIIGFNIYRTGPEGRQQLNSQILPSLVGGQTSGSTYQFTDSTVSLGNSYEYTLETVYADSEARETYLGRVMAMRYLFLSHISR